MKITEFNKISYLLTSKTYHHWLKMTSHWKNQLSWILSQNLQILNTAVPGRVHILQTFWRLWGTKTFWPWHNTLPQNNYQHMYSRNCLAWQEIVVDILKKKQWQEYGCKCWRLSNFTLMTQNQVKEHCFYCCSTFQSL